MNYSLKRLFLMVAVVAMFCAVTTCYYQRSRWSWLYWDPAIGWTEYTAPIAWRATESLFVGMLVAGIVAFIIWLVRNPSIP